MAFRPTPNVPPSANPVGRHFRVLLDVRIVVVAPQTAFAVPRALAGFRYR